MKASYLKLLKSGELEKRTRQALSNLGECRMCPHQCGTDRTAGETGFCQIGAMAMYSSFGAHFGEERPISGTKGSGTVFFSGCNMRCIYCQNFEVSQGLEGHGVTGEFLALFFLSLQEEGCHNINLVTPSHVVPQILEAVLIAAREGLKIPLVYNSGGYDSLSTLQLLDGIIDIYMPDIKYSDNRTALELSKVKNYWHTCQKAVREMFRQVGNLRTNRRGIAQRGLLIRHLVLPGGLSGTAEVMRFISRDISKDAVVNLMDQYRPCASASSRPPLDRPLYPEEFQEALEHARAAGLTKVMQFAEEG